MRKRLHALWEHIKTEHTSPERVGVAVFVGVLLGVIPLYGIQTPICLAVAQLTKLNKATVVVAANISNPLIAPFLIAAGIAIGEYLRFGELHAPDLGKATTFIEQLALLSGEVPDLFLSCLIGDTLLGLVLGVVFGLAAYRVALNRSATDPSR
ncbi:MAG: DUF2062 domain-containing protein [Proteobacteria bacterium]|nr:DUF2062 domain-containing protein [Pseudomonadota bacterium]